MADNDILILKRCQQVRLSQGMDALNYQINATCATVKSLRVLGRGARHKTTGDAILDMCKELLGYAKFDSDALLRQYDHLRQLEREIAKLQKG
jgi:hypothetical protein